jgi:hypothetical protein
MKRLSSLSICFVALAALFTTACQQSPIAPGTVEDFTPLAPAVEQGVKIDGEHAIRVLSGQFLVDSSTRSVELKGTHGMRVAAAVLDQLVDLFPFRSCFPCGPGVQVSLDGTLVGLSLGGTVTLRGETTRIGMGPYDAGVSLVFSGPSVVAPPITDEPVQLSAPFELLAVYGGVTEYSRVFTPSQPGGQPLIGHGVATLVFERVADLPLWQISRSVYRFDH